MQLNYDCIRDVLLALEETEIDEELSFDSLESKLQYNRDDIWYSCHMLYESDYIVAVKIEMDNLPLPYYPVLENLTFQGHEFLKTIRNEKVWEKVKKTAIQLGTASVGALSQIAISTFSEFIQKKLF